MKYNKLVYYIGKQFVRISSWAIKLKIVRNYNMMSLKSKLFLLTIDYIGGFLTQVFKCRISGRILQLETVTQSEAIRRHYRYPSHFSLTTTFQVPFYLYNNFKYSFYLLVSNC
jgi:hypothetical protein